jgi:hypothetical protein
VPSSIGSVVVLVELLEGKNLLVLAVELFIPIVEALTAVADADFLFPDTVVVAVADKMELLLLLLPLRCCLESCCITAAMRS